ncbi:hypothetical protein IV203_037306 [Nitzschia inconspicua]|uniref:Uncharacterized protein n=1 Tax=Nitzschia inconspicua TaxID=303405 RepID=A0A9K3K978_9STRA|nr:hypothetical protein IV203_006339 [Nitzschia inconspicua]KAG7364104.1 hypothetical protein IV203_037306 [Nitzschia inconspicua]
MIRQALSKLLLPNLERDLNNAVRSELSSAHEMANCFLSSTSVYAYLPTTSRAATVGRGTMRVQQGPVKYTKVDYSYKTPNVGLFQ